MDYEVLMGLVGMRRDAVPAGFDMDEWHELFDDREAWAADVMARQIDPAEQDERAQAARVRRENMAAARLQNDGRCVYCGAPATCADHIFPESRGGSSDPSNLAPACKPCNSSKGARTPAEWLGL